MKYENQYYPLSTEQRIRTTFEPSLADYACLRSFDPKTGVLQTTLSILLTKLCHELRNSKIEPGDWAAYQHALCECRIVLPDNVQRSSAPVPTPRSVSSGPEQTAPRDVRRRAKRMAPKAA